MAKEETAAQLESLQQRLAGMQKLASLQQTRHKVAEMLEAAEFAVAANAGQPNLPDLRNIRDGIQGLAFELDGIIGAETGVAADGRASQVGVLQIAGIEGPGRGRQRPPAARAPQAVRVQLALAGHSHDGRHDPKFATRPQVRPHAEGRRAWLALARRRRITETNPARSHLGAAAWLVGSKGALCSARLVPGVLPNSWLGEPPGLNHTTRRARSRGRN